MTQYEFIIKDNGTVVYTRKDRDLASALAAMVGFVKIKFLQGGRRRF